MIRKQSRPRNIFERQRVASNRCRPLVLIGVAAHDLVDGYGGKIIKVKLDKATGDGFKVIR